MCISSGPINFLFWPNLYHFCQAQPKPQFNWAELAILSLCTFNLLIRGRNPTRNSSFLSTLPMDLSQIMFISPLGKYQCIYLSITKPSYLFGPKMVQKDLTKASDFENWLKKLPIFGSITFPFWERGAEHLPKSKCVSPQDPLIPGHKVGKFVGWVALFLIPTSPPPVRCPSAARPSGIV